MKQINISVSPVQLRKLRKGGKVRVKPPMKGMGVYSLVVEPNRYDELSKTFRRGLGKEVALSSAELDANRQMGGEGIFGKKFDNFLGKIGIKKEVYKLGDMIKEPVKKAIREVASGAPAAFATAGASLATAVGHPELAPIAMAAGKKLGEKARNYSNKHIEGYIDDPEAYQNDPNKFADFRGVGLKVPMKKESRDMKRAAVSRGVAMASASTNDLGTPQFAGSGLYAGASRGSGMKEMPHTRAIVGTRGGMIGLHHPALASQAMSSHFHRQYQTIPNFQKFHQMGAGLYA